MCDCGFCLFCYLVCFYSLLLCVIVGFVCFAFWLFGVWLDLLICFALWCLVWVLWGVGMVIWLGVFAWVRCFAGILSGFCSAVDGNSRNLTISGVDII